MTDEVTIERFRSIVGDRLSTDAKALADHAHDAAHHPPCPPQVVVWPESTTEIASVVEVCAEIRLPIIPFGTGTAVEGGVVAVRGGVCIDLTRMNRIVVVNAADMDCTVEAGVTRYQLNRRMAELGTGLHFPVDPGADASLGGMAATCASGPSAVRYGTMRESVLGLKVVTADGRVIQTGGRARKSSAGYDLTRLFVGSEGTLGVIAEVALRLVRQPAAISAAVCPFPAIEPAVRAVIDVLQSGITPAKCELLDEVLIEAVNRYSGLNNATTPTLFFEFHGSERAVAEEATIAGEIVARHGGGPFHWTADEAECTRLWQARYDSYYATLALRPGGAGYVTDVCVPVSELAGCIARTKELLKSTAIPCPLFGHVGDGNYHVVFVIERGSPTELAEVQRLSDRIVDDALSVGGTCTGEHGIGLGKLDALERECGDAVQAMIAVKRALDPQDIMNPGKVVRME